MTAWRPLLVLAALTPGVSLPEQTHGAMTARLAVHVADAGPQPGAALVLLTLEVTGGPLLQVEPATLADPVNVWEADRNEWCTLTDGRMTWTQSIWLKQIKPGTAALPDVKLRFRDGPSGPWEEAEWVDLLKVRDAPPPELSPPPAAAPSWLAWAYLAAAVLALTAIVLGVSRRRRFWRCEAPTPYELAMAEFQRLDKSAITDVDSAAYHTELSNIVRGYLADRFGLPATRRTTAEFLAAAAQTDRLSAEQLALLRDFLERCDLAKFAPVGAAPEECREAASLARAFVERTAGGAI